MLLPLSGLLAGVKPRVKLLALDIPHSGNPKVRYDTVFSLGPFNIDKSLFRCPYLCYLPLSGLLAGVKPRVKLLALAIPYSGNPKVGETGVGCHTGWLSHCQYLIRWVAVPCRDLHVTCA